MTYVEKYFEIFVNIYIYIAVICCPVCDVIRFEIKPRFLSRPFFYIPESQNKNVNILRTKRAFNN